MKLHAVIRGRVQGVGFRYFVVQCARDLGVRGWVRNLANGDVEVEAVAGTEALDALEQALWQGPQFARVADVEVMRTDENPKYASFEIR